MAIDKKIMELDKKAKRQVRETLRAIDIALKLNSPRLKEKRIPGNLRKLMRWKTALEGWQGRYGASTSVIDMAEGLGAYHELCISQG